MSVVYVLRLGSSLLCYKPHGYIALSSITGWFDFPRYPKEDM